MVAASYPFLDVLWSMVIFFVFVIWIWMLITVFAESSAAATSAAA